MKTLLIAGRLRKLNSMLISSQDLEISKVQRLSRKGVRSKRNGKARNLERDCDIVPTHRKLGAVRKDDIGVKMRLLCEELEDTVAEALVVPEEIRGQIPADFGRAKGIAWYYLGFENCPLMAQAVNDNIVNSGEALAA